VKGQALAQLTLPLRMKMQVNLINQDDGWFVKRVQAVGVTSKQTPANVGHPRHHCLVPKAELAKANFTIRRTDVYAAFPLRAESGWRIDSDVGRLLDLGEQRRDHFQ
jgi:hypothetical protein